MQKQRVLLISYRREFISFCRVVLKNDFEFYNTDINDISYIKPEFLTVSIVLIDGKSFPDENAFSLRTFLQDTIKKPVFICKDKNLCLKDGIIPLNKNLKKNITENLDAKDIPYKEKTYSESQQKKENLRQEFKEHIKIACKSESIVLLTGESGTGKNYAARFIHENSSRKEKLFTSLNLAEINPNLIESTLFGASKGSFTSAEEKSGILEKARDGTLFLDEIAQLNIESQGKFLSLLDTMNYRKVGSTKELNLKARLIFATDENLKELMAKGLFKKQLFYRISVLVINIPPLRERKEEIKTFATDFARTFGKNISENAVEKLKQCQWPGNIRQLKNCIERSCVYSEKKTLYPEDIIFL